MPNFETVRSQFPITQTSVFLNHAENGVTKHDSWLRDQARVRQQVAALVSGSSEAVVFVQNTSSGLSLAANGIRWKAW
jgi:selenocysteine lyase/cysteine desulfurase